MSVRRRLTLTAVVWAVGLGGLRLSALAPEGCRSLEEAQALDAAAAAAAWIEAGQQGDGRYLYEYDRRADEARPGYNIVRHAGVTMSLYQLVAAGAGGDLAAADEGLELMLDGLVAAGGGLALIEPGARTARLGASALMAAALEARRDATGDRRYDEELRALGRFLAVLIGPDGRTLAAYDLDLSAPVPGETSRYATGEAGWALARLHSTFPDEGWDVPARAVADYLATERDDVEGLDFRPWPDQWAAYLLAELGPSQLEAHHLSYARSLAERFGMLVRVESQKDGWPPVFVDPRARGAGLGVWVEALGALERLAAVDDRLADLRPALATRLECGAVLLIERQVDELAAQEFAAPDLVQGAWFREGRTRMDDQQHALSGLLAAAGRLVVGAA
jgi:hypothetical protein